MTLMITLALASIETLVNATLSDHLNHEDFANLQAKVLRIVIHAPNLSFDVVFADDAMRFEPVCEPIFEPKAGELLPPIPDGTLSFQNPSDLIQAFKNHSPLPYFEGDETVLNAFCQLFTHAGADFLTQLETLVNQNLGHHLKMLNHSIVPAFKQMMTKLTDSNPPKTQWQEPTSHQFDDS